MLLKQLVVKGFKSFADKTEVGIPPGITIFVGPNGCGKSNVSDAIRWVMGEQNPRNLRGMKMQDMIFAGAETRKAESMSEVSLVFDNPDGFFNLPQAEVMITRRLYRSGESEYLINKTPVRLKDILELFMDTGLGHHGYTLIEQGRVEHMLSSKPSDRLAIFEEAAGVTRYKARRDEALRKLHRAEQDLLRLNDIEEELGKQSRSLRRQAQQASRHKRLVEELQSLDQIIASREGTRLTAEKQALEKQTQEVTDLLNGEQSQIVALETRQAEVSLHIDGFTARLREQHENYHRLQMDIQKRESQLAFLKETKTELSQRRANLEKEIQQNQSKKQHLTAEIENKRLQIEMLEQQQNEHQQQYDSRLKNLEQIRADRRSLDQQMEGLRNRLWEIQKDILSCHNEMQQIQQQKEFLDSQDERALRERESLEQQLQNVIESQGHLSEEIQAKREELQQTIERLTEVQESLARSSDAIKDLTERLRQEEKLLDQYKV
ncbi:MAG TPA: AAA family ATPase, partial [bacterium]|nr:AAA family ATPase [bacterium]